MEPLKIEYLGVDELTPYKRNARKHETKDIDAIVSSINEFGFDDPIGIWGDRNVIVEGHGRLLAAKKIGMEKVPVIRLDHLTDEQRRAYALAHNRTAELSNWDFELQSAELKDIFNINMADFGFELPEEKESAEIVEDDVPETVETKCKVGDLWELGNHRLICGDSTDESTIARLMDGKKADMVFTDPPYNIDYHGVNDKRTIQNDKMDDKRFVEFLKSSLMDCETMYVCCSWQYAHLFRRAIEENGNKVKAMIVWDKVYEKDGMEKTDHFTVRVCWNVP